MTTALDNLPCLREELNLFASAPARDGSPTWRLHDLARNQFFSLDWVSFEILARWDLNHPEAIAKSVNQETTLQIDMDDVEVVRQFLVSNHLCQIKDAEGTALLLRHQKMRQSSVWKWLLHHYLFFRVPLVRPDRWLTRHAARVAPLYSRFFFILTFIILLFGLSQCARQWTRFVTTLVDTFSMKGMLSYAITLLFVKTLHELGHAFTAKRKGCRVPTMGVAFLVMWPVAYTDVNDAWKLKRRQDRLAVGAAGIVTELTLAAWATFFWGFLPEGNLKNAAFLIATTTWISSILINASPFMRFDGYFLLSDYLEFPNLHSRSFELAKWDLRERLFRLGEPVPEILTPARRRGLIFFAWLVWLYRLVLFLGIAVLVYHFFFKLLGIFLFIVEIGFFVMFPIWRELREWHRRSATIIQSKRTRISGVLFCVIVVIGTIPWYTHVESQGVLRATQYFPIYAPGSAQISSMIGQVGMRIAAGEPLITLSSPDLDYHLVHAELLVKNLSQQLEYSSFDEGMRARQPIVREELASAHAARQGYLCEKKRYVIRAPFSGVLVDIVPELEAGMWVNREERLGLLIDPTRWQVEAYVQENALHRIKVGDAARFFPETPGATSLRMRVTRIDSDATRVLLEPMLAIEHGGHVIAREKHHQLIPEKSIYRVILEVENAALFPHAMRGHVVIEGARKSILGDYFRTGLAVLIRESGW